MSVALSIGVSVVAVGRGGLMVAVAPVGAAPVGRRLAQADAAAATGAPGGCALLGSPEQTRVRVARPRGGVGPRRVGRRVVVALRAVTEDLADAAAGSVGHPEREKKNNLEYVIFYTIFLLSNNLKTTSFASL